MPAAAGEKTNRKKPPEIFKVRAAFSPCALPNQQVAMFEVVDQTCAASKTTLQKIALQAGKMTINGVFGVVSRGVLYNPEPEKARQTIGMR